MLSQAWEHRALILATIAVGLFAFSVRAVQRVMRLEADLAAKPRVVEKVVVKTETKKIQGPVRVVEKLVEGKVVERVVYKDPVVTETKKDAEKDHVETPICPAPHAAPTRFAGLLVPPTGNPADLIVHGGVTLGEHIDFGYGFQPHGGIHRLEGNWRW